MAVLCPGCEQPLDAADACCASCGSQAACVDGAVLLHPDVAGDHADYDDGWHAKLRAVEQAHFWFATRRRVIAGMFHRYVPTTARVLEIGAGTGNTARMLQDAGYDRLAVGELHASGVRLAGEYGVRERYQFDLLRNPFVAEFDAVAMFDVIEHLDDDVGAAAELHRMLRPGGHALFTVPAHQWLWCAHDVRSGHKRRYTRRTLSHLLRGAGFEVVEMRHFFVSVLPLLLIRHWQFDPSEDIAPGPHDEGLHPPGVANAVARTVLGLEASLARLLPFPAGGSLWAVARKA